MAKTYAQLYMGTKNDKETVKIAQQLLNEKLGTNLAVDGIFGNKTLQAVKTYQGANQLQVDGIIGPKTWASLLTTKDESQSHEPTLAEAVEQARQAYTHATEATEDFVFDKQALHDLAEEAYLHREEFSYDPNADAMYQQYKDQYTTAGKRAMEDTMGKAVALTGGYGNSYAQTAGQQVYQEYLQQLHGKLPELYALALDRYEDDTDKAYKTYATLKEERENAYAAHLKEQREKKEALYDAYQDAIKQQDAAYKRLYQLLLKGYIPTDRELKNAGMTRAMANAILA